MNPNIPTSRRTLLPQHHRSYHYTITAQPSVAKRARRNAQISIKQKLKREHHLKGALRNQSNKHQNSQKPMLKAEQTQTSCMPKTAVSPNFNAHQLGLARSK